MDDIVKTRFRLIAAKAELMAHKSGYWAQDIWDAIREIENELDELRGEARRRTPGDR